MFLEKKINELIDNKKTVNVTLIGAGKFGSMFLSQAPYTKGLNVFTICDLKIDKAKKACLEVGWSEDQINNTIFTEDFEKAINDDEVDVVVEATGHPSSGIKHARTCFKYGKHVIMVNVEADVLAGPSLSAEANSAEVVFSMAYGDQPSLTLEIIEWARASGFKVTAAGKGTKYLPEYHYSTPKTVWDHYGLTSDEAENAGMNSKMFNSFLDGTKSSLEMSAIANASGLNVPNTGLLFPPCGMDDLASLLKEKNKGGILEKNEQVEVVSSLERDGRPVFKDLRWGVYAVLQAPNDYAASCFKQYGMNTDQSGEFSAMYKPFHLIGMELNTSIFSAALLKLPTGQTKYFKGDVVSVSKRNLKKGEKLDGEGGFTVWGKLIPASTSLNLQALPIGLANDMYLKNDINKDKIITWNDVEFDSSDEIINYRHQMENKFRN
ncbi:Gfo/Idh/MocA family oxidoreductase [Alphaproteobacteria bacterium]|nr:Gfo/Idh/MocA family oxidoreductase [Alphaproteobacteria bacterium]